MRQLTWALVIAGIWAQGAPGIAAAGRLTAAQEQRLQALFKQSEHSEHDGDVVKTYVTLREAMRLEQLWTSNMLGDEALSTQRMQRFITTLIRRDDPSVQRILHSKRIALGDKLSLIHVLEQDILVNYSGAGSGQLSGDNE